MDSGILNPADAINYIAHLCITMAQPHQIINVSPLGCWDKVPSSKDTPAGILDRPFGHVHSSRLLVGITNAGLLCISDEGKLNNNLECHCARA